MKILFINACARKESRTLILAKELLLGLPGQIEEVNLFETDLKPLDAKRIVTRVIDLNEQIYAKQFAQADIIVIAAPLWDLSFPAALKVYIENITISGITFKYTEKGPKGLCNAKVLYYVSTSGGEYVKDYGYEYIKSLCNVLFGIKNTECFTADRLDIYGSNVVEILEDSLEEINTYTNKIE